MNTIVLKLGHGSWSDPSYLMGFMVCLYVVGITLVGETLYDNRTWQKNNLIHL